MIGNPLETTIALSHLIFEGTLDQFPGLEDLRRARRRLPALVRRAVGRRRRDLPRPRHDRDAQEEPTEYLRQLYYDSIVFTPEALRHLVAETGSGQIVMGTDYPFPWTKTSVDHILGTPGLTDAERIAMLGGTAAPCSGSRPSAERFGSLVARDPEARPIRPRSGSCRRPRRAWRR